MIVCVVLDAWVPALAVKVGLGDKGPVGLGHQRGEPIILIGGEQPLTLPIGLYPGKRPESLDRPEDVKQLSHLLDQLLDGTLLGLGAGELNGRLLQARPGIVPELPQAVVRLQVRASRHGHHLRDLPLAAQSCAASRLKATIYPARGSGQETVPGRPVRCALAPRHGMPVVPSAIDRGSHGMAA